MYIYQPDSRRTREQLQMYIGRKLQSYFQIEHMFDGNKSILDIDEEEYKLLPDKLKSKIKIVKKTIDISTWSKHWES